MSTIERHATAKNGPFVVGGVGHRTLESDEIALRDSIRRNFESLIEERGGDPRRILLIVSVAEGADRLLIDAAIALDIPYVCVLPCSPACFSEDFPTPDSVETFERQLACAVHIAMPEEDHAERLEGYLWVSQYLIEHSDLLLAVWDGENGNGPAGTADTVETAIRNRIPVLRISANPPHHSVEHEPLAVGRD